MHKGTKDSASHLWNLLAHKWLQNSSTQKDHNCMFQGIEHHWVSEFHVQGTVPKSQKWKDKDFAFKEFKVLGRQTK